MCVWGKVISSAIYKVCNQWLHFEGAGRLTATMQQCIEYFFFFLKHPNGYKHQFDISYICYRIHVSYEGDIIFLYTISDCVFSEYESNMQ